MTKTTKILLGVVIVSILIVGVAYAAITNVTLNIQGTATADPSQANFTVKFSQDEGATTKSSEKVTATVTDDTNAVLNVTGLTTKGETVTATYTVQNTSADLSAVLTPTITNGNTEYFAVTHNLGTSKTLTKGEAITVTVTVELIKNAIEDTVTGSIGLQLVAEPVQPTT